MRHPEEPLVWPPHFPPTDRWKKFFIGIRKLGPDLSFFKDLKQQQASRTPDSMASWHIDTKQGEVLAAICEVLHKIVRWKTKVFLPKDEFKVILYGPKFQSMYEPEIAIWEIERRLRIRMAESFWESTEHLTLQEVVNRLADEIR